MIIAFGIVILALGIWIGKAWGYEQGKTALEREILHHVAESSEYEDAVVESFRKAFNRKVKKRKNHVFKGEGK